MLVLPSLDEGFGLTALEAMAAGVPVVAARRGSLPEVVGDAGTLIEPEDVEALTSAMECLIVDDAAARAHAAAGLARAATFTWDRTAQTLRQAYVDAIARRRAR
jgi:glycosyltransferase involved in cell wall biosynthesis